MKPIYLSIITLILAGVVSYATTKAVVPSSSSSVMSETKPKKSDESVYDRVMRTGELRCGIGIWPPFTIYESETSKASGTFPEIVETAMARMDIEVKWVEELGWSNFIEALKTNRIDAMCAGIFPESIRGKHIDFSIPAYYLGRGVYVRYDDDRFDDDFSKLNSSEYHFSAVDGDNVEVTQAHFPKAKILSLPQLTDYTQMMMNVVTKKADAVVINTYTGQDFIANNPKTLKRIGNGTFLEVYGGTIAFNKNEEQFKSMVNVAFEELLNNGTVEKIIKKYDEYPNTILRVPKPYQVAE